MQLRRVPTDCVVPRRCARLTHGSSLASKRAAGLSLCFSLARLPLPPFFHLPASLRFHSASRTLRPRRSPERLAMSKAGQATP